MNGKFEDKLARLAFGELSTEEAARLEQEVQQDPAAQQALKLYREMRDGLKCMADVPEDQFSQERLRDAILAQGLRPLPPKRVSNRGWLWMPAAACALGFGLVFAQKTLMRSHQAPAVMLGNVQAPSLGPGDGNNAFVFNPVRPTVHPSVTPRSAVRMVASNSDSRRAKPKDPIEFDPHVQANNLSGDEEFDPNLVDTSAVSTAPAPTSHVDPLALATPNSSGPIVLIDQDKDSQTGACRATEVGSSSNVLVGG